MGFEKLGHQPTPDEVKAAEDAMYEEQKTASMHREQKLDMEEKLEASGFTFEYKRDGNTSTTTLKGSPKGHRVEVSETSDGGYVKKYGGSIDGIKISDENARILYKKYREGAVSEDALKEVEDRENHALVKEKSRKLRREQDLMDEILAR